MKVLRYLQIGVRSEMLKSVKTEVKSCVWKEEKKMVLIFCSCCVTQLNEARSGAGNTMCVCECFWEQTIEIHARTAAAFRQLYKREGFASFVLLWPN